MKTANIALSTADCDMLTGKTIVPVLGPNKPTTAMRIIASDVLSLGYSWQK